MNNHSYNTAVEQYADSLYRYALKQVRDAVIASDVVQDAFEVLWHRRKQVHKDKARSYLFAVVHNRIIDHYRRAQLKAENEPIDPNQYYYTPEYTGATELIDYLLQQLPPDQRSVLVLRDYEGYSYREIATITNLTQEQVKVYIYRARKYLRNYIVKKDNLL